MKRSMLVLALAVTMTVTGCSMENEPPLATAPETSVQESVEGAAEMQRIDLPILDEINNNTTVGMEDSFKTAVQSAVKLLDWGTFTGLDPEEIRTATVAWLSDKGNDAQVAFAEKLSQVDAAYQTLLSDGAEALLQSAGCENTAYPWSDAPVEAIEAIMDAVGLR